MEGSLYPHLWANVCDPMMSEPEKEKKSYTLWWAAPSILSSLYTKPPFLLNWTPLSNNMPPVLNFKCFISPHPLLTSPMLFPPPPAPWKNSYVVVLLRIVRLESLSQPFCWMACNTWGSVTWDRKEWQIPPKKKEKCGLCPVGYPSSIKLQLSYN